MGMPGGLLEFTSPIVNKALETGARGSTTTETNYGVIGDAFFKKAQNDLGIAKLQSDIASDAAHLKVDTAMNTANLNLNKANILLDTSLRTQQLIQQQKQWEAENTVSGSEMFFGSLTGAMQGGVTGFMATGTPQGAMVGAALGGVSTYGAYREGGRHGGQAAQQFLGTAAQLSTAIKGYNEEKTAKDGWKTWVDTGTKILGVLNSPTAESQERLDAAQQWSAHLSEGAKVMSSMGMNPQQISTAIQGYDKAMRTGGASVIGADGKAMGGMEQMQNAFKYAADPDFSPTAPPEKQRAKAKQFYADAATIFANQHGGKLIPAELVAAQAETIKPGMGDVIASSLAGKLRTAPSGRIVTSMDHTDPNTLKQYQQGRITDPQVGNPITPTPPSYSIQNQVAPGVPFRQPTVSGGVEMDDGGDISEVDLQKQGANTVKALEQGNINLDNRPVLHNPDGTVSTEKSITIEEDGKFINIPTIINGKEVSPQTAIAFYHDTGEHLGKFASEQEAEQAAQDTHQYQEKRTTGEKEPGVLERSVRAIQDTPLKHLPVFDDESTLNRMADEKEMERTGHHPNEKFLQQAYQEKNISSASDVRKEVFDVTSTIDTSKDKIKGRKVTGLQDAMYSAERLEKSMAKVPHGTVAEIEARGHAYGLKSTDYAAAAAIMGTGLKGKALISQLKEIGGKKAVQAAGVMGAFGIASSWTGALDKFDQDLIQPFTKGKGYGLSEEEQKAVNEFTSASRDFVESQIMAETGKEPRVEQIVADVKNFISFSDTPETRAHKLATAIDEIRDSAYNLANRRQGEPENKYSGTSLQEQKDQLDLQFKRNRNRMQEQKMGKSTNGFTKIWGP